VITSFSARLSPITKEFTVCRFDQLEVRSGSSKSLHRGSRNSALKAMASNLCTMKNEDREKLRKLSALIFSSSPTCSFYLTDAPSDCAVS